MPVVMFKDRSFAGNVAFNDVTKEALTINMSLTGVDPVYPIKITTQAEATVKGSFRTVKAAIAALPDRLAFNVMLQFPTGTWGLTMQDLYDLPRLMANSDSNKRAVQNTYVDLIFAGDNSWLQVPTTPASMAVQSQVGEIVTLQADPGLAQDAFAGNWLVVLSGTGAGQYKSLRYHSGASFQVTQAFSPALNSTSVVQIATRPTIFSLIDADDVAIGYGYIDTVAGTSYPTWGAPRIVFRRVEISASQPNYNRLSFYGFLAAFDAGSRILDRVRLGISGRGALLLDDVILHNAVLTVSGSSLSSNYRAGISVLFYNSTGEETAITVSGLSSTLAYIGFLCDVAFQGYTNSFMFLYGAVYTNLSDGTGTLRYKSDGAAAVAVEARYGGRVISNIPFATLAASTFRGAISDLRMDGEYVTWDEVDLEADKTVTTKLGSMVTPLNLTP